MRAAEPMAERHGADGGAMSGRRYCLITPCRDEAAHIARTLDSTIAQTVRPARWVIVDDGSTDATPDILAGYAARHPFITVVTRRDRGGRAVGPGVIQAFEAGLATVNLADYDYIAKFDGDLELPPRYFERTLERMEADAYLGNLSGKLFERLADGTLYEERTGDENAVGPVKFYRTACFEDIGGFVPEVCWDGIDGHRCRMEGWIAQSVDDPEMRIVHLRPMGSSDRNILVGRLRWGRGKYFMGSAWYYVLAAALYRTIDRPWLVGGLAIAWGYGTAAVRRRPRYDEPAYRAYVTRFERAQLLMGKGRATDLENARIRRRGLPGHPEDRRVGWGARG